MARHNDSGQPDHPGRPTDLTEDLALAIASFIEEGNYRDVAAAVHEVHEKTIGRWIRWGKQRPGSIYAQFRTLVLEAEAKNQVNGVRTLKRHAEKDPASARFFLERRHHRHWGKHRGELDDLQQKLRDLERRLDEGDKPRG